MRIELDKLKTNSKPVFVGFSILKYCPAHAYLPSSFPDISLYTLYNSIVVFFLSFKWAQKIHMAETRYGERSQSGSYTSAFMPCNF